MSHLQYTAKSHHLQWNIHQLSKISHHFYQNYCPDSFKHLWFYGFKVHMLVTSGYILTYVVTPVSVHDIKVVYELLEGCKQSVILGNLGYLSSELKKDLEQVGYHLWTPFRKNMTGANWKVMVMRRTIETRFSELCRLFDIEHTLARLAGLQLRIEQIILAHNLRYFEMN
ncbi:TPA: IS982 family transposase [Streptococcus suis]|nr:IS982 family transposase [Streptococcus suis]